MARASAPQAASWRVRRFKQPWRSRPQSVAIIAALAALVLSTSGCTSLREWWHNGFKVGPNYAQPPAPVANQWMDAADPRVKHEPVQDCAWWTVFGDPALNRLIETAHSQNLDLRIAGSASSKPGRNETSPREISFPSPNPRWPRTWTGS